MADIGLDYAGSSPGAAAVKAAGYNFVARYLSRYTSKVITAGEYLDMSGNGVGVVVVFEDSANQALNGYNQGVADAQFALGQARSVGWPENRPIYFAVDFDIAPAQKAVAGEYMKGVASVLGVGRVGAYGGYWWIKYCVDNGLASFFWQAIAWSGGMVHPNANLFQRLGGTTVNGTSCDINDALQPDYGQNNYQGENDMVPDKNHLDALFLAFRNRYPVQSEYDAYVGKISYNGMVEALNSGDERSAVSHALEVGEVALADNWQQQIQDLQKKVADLENATSTPTPSPTPTPTPVPTDPVIAVGGNQSFWEWIKSIFIKK